MPTCTESTSLSRCHRALEKWNEQVFRNTFLSRCPFITLERRGSLYLGPILSSQVSS